MKKRVLYLLLLSTSILLCGCAMVYNPATGKREAIFINTQTEVNIGRNVAQEVLRRYKVLNDSSVQQQVREIGQKVARVSDRQDLEYSFTVLDSKELNAFALPGGGVYINKGLVDILDQDEIASVLAHEVGHIAARHAAKRIQGQMGYQLIMTVASYQLTKKDRKMARTVNKSTNTIFNLVLLGYSRQDELLADKLAVKYAHLAGYNAWGTVSGLRKLKKHSQQKRHWRPLIVLRSHPYLDDRIRAAEAEVGMLAN